VNAKKVSPDWNVLRGDEDKRLLAAATSHLATVVITALLQHGMRASELCRISWTDVRQIGTALEVSWMGKGAKTISKRLKPRTAEMAAAWCVKLGAKGVPGEKLPLIPADSTLRALTRFEVWEIVTTSAKAAKLRVTPHGLRATYISRIIASDGIEAARQMVGHDDIGTTQRYSRWANRDDRDE
jgi:integrase